MATRLLYGRLHLATTQFQAANTVAALAKGQFNLTSELLPGLLSDLKQRLAELKNKLAETDLHALNQPVPGLVEKLQQSMNEVEARLEEVRRQTRS